MSGEVTVHADDIIYPADVDDNGRLCVTIENVVPVVEYKISVHFTEQTNDKIKEAIRRNITRLQMDNNQKNELYTKLCKSDRANYENIVQRMPVPDIAKNKLLEISFGA